MPRQNDHKDAAAMVKIVEQYPALTSFVRAPLITNIAPFAERLVAANRRFLFGRSSPLFWLKFAAIVAFSIGLLLSARLWTGPRSYPLAPVFGLPIEIDGWLAYGLFAALLVLACAILVAPKPQWFLATFLAIIATFCLADQTRWQPWVFLYAFLLLTLTLFSWRSDDIDGQRRTLNIARLLLAFTYIFSGLQKINLNFVENEFPWIVQPITNFVPATKVALHVIGWIAPFVQIAFGVGLLTKRWRRLSLVAAIGMHAFILLMFGPLGQNWNDVIWPWTAAMAAFDLVLFSGKATYSARDVLWPSTPYHAVVLLTFAVLPWFSFVNLWDSYLSAALYSGNLTEAEIYLSDAGKASLPSAIQGQAVATSENTNVINIQRWAIEELNVTPYPEARVYKAMAKQICAQLADRKDLVLIVREQRMLFARPETGYRCWQL